MKYALLLISLLNFASFLWSIIGVFKKEEEQQSLKYRLLQINTGLLWVLLPYSIYNSQLSDVTYSVVTIIQLFCLATFWAHTKIVKENSFSIVFSEDKPKKLIRSGFYKRIRHPFYTIYLVSYFSISLATLDILTLTLSATMLLLYTDAAKFEENKFSNSDLKAEYDQYKKESGMFYPKF